MIIEDKKLNIVCKHLGWSGRMISGTKSGYKGRAVFNSNLCAKDGKIWYGDIDLDRDLKKLQEIANELEEEIFILKEMDGRFENEEKPLLEKAVLKVSPVIKI